MKVYAQCQIGQFHTDQNEDAFKIAKIGSNQKLISIFDGCSSGTESHFSSTLFSKIAAKIAKDQFYKEFATNASKSNASLLEIVLKEIFNTVKAYKADLDLENLELLSTIVLGIVNTKEHSASLMVIGDGIIAYDSQLIEFENDNKPDYLAYSFR